MTIEPPTPLKRNPLHIDVIYPATVATKEMMMRLGVIVIVGLGAFDGYLMNEPVLFKEIKGVIDRGSREGGIDPPQGLVDLISGGMVRIALEKLQDRGPLNGQENPLVFEICLLLLEGHRAHAILITRKEGFVKN
jgi:hypothetical protein